MSPISRLIVVEGAHGSGKTTLAKALARSLTREGMRSKYTKEPYSPLLRRSIDELASKSSRNPLALAYLVAADRQLHLGQIRRWLRERVTVVADRYLDSSLVYQRIDGLPLALIKRLNFFVPIPKVRIYVETPYDIRLTRLKQKAGPRSNHRFLSAPSLRKEERLYRALLSRKLAGVQTLVIDGTQPTRENVKIAKQFVMRHE